MDLLTQGSASLEIAAPQLLQGIYTLTGTSKSVV